MKNIYKRKKQQRDEIALEEKAISEEIKEKDKTFYRITEQGIKIVEEAKKINEVKNAFGL